MAKRPIDVRFIACCSAYNKYHVRLVPLICLNVADKLDPAKSDCF